MYTLYVGDFNLAPQKQRKPPVQKRQFFQTSGNRCCPTKSPLSVVFTWWLTNRSVGRWPPVLVNQPGTFFTAVSMMGFWNMVRWLRPLVCLRFRALQWPFFGAKQVRKSQTIILTLLATIATNTLFLLWERQKAKRGCWVWSLWQRGWLLCKDIYFVR